MWVMPKMLGAVCRHLVLIAAIGLVSGAVVNTARADELLDAAKKEGKVVWYVAQFDVDTAEKIAAAFEKANPGIDVDVLRASTGVIYQRVLQEAEANVFAADVYSTPDEGHAAALKSQGMLECYTPPAAVEIVKELQGADPDGCYYTTSAWLILISYSTKNVPESEAPKDWKDLLDPRWKGKIAIGHPAYSGSVATWVNQLELMYGWSYFEKLEQQEPRVGRSINETVTVLNSGEQMVAVGLDVTTLKSKNSGNPIDVIYPESGSVRMLAPSAVLKKAAHPNAARLFLNFMMSKRFSEVLADNAYHPIRPDVKPMPGSKSLADVKSVRPPLEQIEKGNPKVIEKFRSTFGI